MTADARSSSKKSKTSVPFGIKKNWDEDDVLPPQLISAKAQRAPSSSSIASEGLQNSKKSQSSRQSESEDVSAFQRGGIASDSNDEVEYNSIKNHSTAKFQVSPYFPVF